jgi:hypothetical protein
MNVHRNIQERLKMEKEQNIDPRINRRKFLKAADISPASLLLQVKLYLRDTTLYVFQVKG